MEEEEEKPIKKIRSGNGRTEKEDLYFRAEEIFNRLKSYSHFHGLNFFTVSETKCVEDLTRLI